MHETIELFRPVGLEEMNLVRELGFEAFPPRLPEQPIFYPVLSADYARQIARDWNVKYNSSRAGFVTRFRVRTTFLQRYEVQTVGGSEHREYWIPAGDLDELNANIVGKIEVIAEYFG